MDKDTTIRLVIQCKCSNVHLHGFTQNQEQANPANSPWGLEGGSSNVVNEALHYEQQSVIRYTRRKARKPWGDHFMEQATMTVSKVMNAFDFCKLRMDDRRFVDSTTFYRVWTGTSKIHMLSNVERRGFTRAWTQKIGVWTIYNCVDYSLTATEYEKLWERAWMGEEFLWVEDPGWLYRARKNCRKPSPNPPTLLNVSFAYLTVYFRRVQSADEKE